MAKRVRMSCQRRPGAAVLSVPEAAWECNGLSARAGVVVASFVGNPLFHVGFCLIRQIFMDILAWESSYWLLSTRVQASIGIPFHSFPLFSGGLGWVDRARERF
jgi:hypothetical protein